MDEDSKRKYTCSFPYFLVFMFLFLIMCSEAEEKDLQSPSHCVCVFLFLHQACSSVSRSPACTSQSEIIGEVSSQQYVVLWCSGFSLSGSTMKVILLDLVSCTISKEGVCL